MTDKNANGFDAEEMTVELELDDGQLVNCAIITILTVDKKDYIALLPLDEDGNNDDGEVWFYRYEEDENNSDAEPLLTYIDDDEEYENVADAFDEYLDNVEFDEIVFASKNIVDAVIPSSIKQIGESSFNKCSRLKIIKFSKNSELESIESHAFCMTSIKNILIPRKVKKIGEKPPYCNDAYAAAVFNNPHSHLLAALAVHYGIKECPSAYLITGLPEVLNGLLGSELPILRYSQIKPFLVKQLYQKALAEKLENNDFEGG